MSACDNTEVPTKYLNILNLKNYIHDETKHEFYSPLCKSGYLTPLQRKKLREKRSRDVNAWGEDIDLSSLKKVKRMRTIKIKSDGKVNISKRSQIMQKKVTSNIPSIQCPVAKFVSKTINDSTKQKKFFKTSPTKRLEKANFTMSLDLKKNSFHYSDKLFKERSLDYPRLLSSVRSNSEKNSDCIDNCLNYDFKSPCIIKLNPALTLPNNNSNMSKNGVENHISNDKTEDNDPISTSKKEWLFNFEWPSDEIFLERQKNAKALAEKQSILKEQSVENKNGMIEKSDDPVKFYPIFNISKWKLKPCEDAKRVEKTMLKSIKDSSKCGEQMVIDAGQRKIGPKVCHTCGMIYTIGHGEDERLHSVYHDMYRANLKFSGWKKENVIGEYCDGRVIMVRDNDTSSKLKKIEDILAVVNKDLGFPMGGLPKKTDVTFLLFVSNEKRVAGCIVAEHISTANRVLLADNKSQGSLHNSKEKVWRIGNWYSSSESVIAVCGINRIWVSQDFRRRKVASRMVDCLRCHFIYGHVISIQELAFTDPSPDGREFAASYTGTDYFLVYK